MSERTSKGWYDYQGAYHPAKPRVRQREETQVHETDLFSDPSAHAESAASSRDGASLLKMAERAATALLDAQGSFTIGEVREALGKLGLLANDGSENLNALGSLGKKMGCIATGEVVRQSVGLTVSHRNRGSVWRRPDTLAERQAAIERAE